MTERELLQKALDRLSPYWDQELIAEISAHLAQPPAEPLPEDKISEIYMRKSSLQGWELVTAIAREVERAHGIT